MPHQPATESDGPKATASPQPDGKGKATALPHEQNAPDATTISSVAPQPQTQSSTDSKNTAQSSAAHRNIPPSNSAISSDAVSDAAISNEPLSDEALMAALCSGDDNALAPLMQRWELPIKSFLLRLGVPMADVEDIAQEAFVRLYIKRSAYRSGAPFKPWLLTLAANLGRNRLRWRLRRRENSIDAAMEAADAPSAAINNSNAHLRASDALPSELIERKQRRTAVRAAVHALPTKLRTVAICVDLEDLSYAEAAQVLGCSVKAVENRLRRARERIRKQCALWLTEGKL